MAKNLKFNESKKKLQYLRTDLKRDGEGGRHRQSKGVSVHLLRLVHSEKRTKTFGKRKLLRNDKNTDQS